MKERPILFSTPMVQAILAGRKTQTRRIVKSESWMIEQNVNFEGAVVDQGLFGPNEQYLKVIRKTDDTRHRIVCPHGQPGDRLWVRETFKMHISGVEYRADDGMKTSGKWKPSIFMPRDLSRITLEIIAINCERLHDITHLEAVSEGTLSVGTYAELWEKINGKGSWDQNPWVWVIEFKTVPP